jgi:small subunit ribosomal protein S20
MLLLSLLSSTVSAAAEEDPEPRRMAEAYLRATTGEGSDAGREHLLGGVSMDAGIFNLENGKIVSLDPVRRESGDLGSATRLMAMLDKSAKKAIRVSERKRLHNKPIRSATRSQLRRAEAAISGSAANADEAVDQAISALDKAATKGIIHANNAARRKSRMMKATAKATRISARS